MYLGHVGPLPTTVGTSSSLLVGSFLNLGLRLCGVSGATVVVYLLQCRLLVVR